VAIGLWVFRQGCLAEVKWRQRWGAQAPSYVSVNVSTRQLDEESLAQDFAAILRETGADPTRMLIEITETSLMADVEKNLHVLQQLSELGLRVAVDDFGTGYSSLAQLTRMPVSVLKIDKAFVDGVDKQADSRTIIRAIIGLGRSLGMKLVAEGVENEAQMLELRSNGCDFIQGYLCHRPLDEQTFIETVDREMSSEMMGAEPSLYFLLYVSQAAVEMDEGTLANILMLSKQNNQVAGITGCMLYQDGCFMQMLEGSRDNVQKLMAYIQADTRHKDVRIVMQGHEQQRVFLDWSMEFHDMSKIAGAPDFSQWRRRSISFMELAEDARLCYSYITAFKGKVL
jgi:EAL domain-containing protein (putative c-di-GMP-specific phosphodiesterase class I)